MSLIDDGVDIIREENSYEPIAELINDNVVKIRENGYNVLLNTANNHYGCLYLIENELVPILVDKILEEKVQYLLIKTLDILKLLLEGEGGTDSFLETPGIKRLKGLLTHDNPEIRQRAVTDLGSVSFSENGKRATVYESCTLPVCELLTDKVDAVLVAVTLTLTSFS